MKRHWLPGLLAAAALIAAAWACDPTPTPYITPTEPPTEDVQPPEPPQPAGLPDLGLVDVSLAPSNQPGINHEVVGVIVNQGPVDASGFNAGCRYQCPGGPIISGGLDIVIGGYLGANSQSSFRQFVRIACEPVPAVLTLSCGVNEDGSMPESNLSNNTGSYMLNVP